VRLYRKTTQHPFCIYLTREEARELRTEAAIAADLSDDVPLLAALVDRLETVLHAREGGQA
jgi:hypothetical protein